MTLAESSSPVPGSFRDPSGFVFAQDGELFRQVNQSYRAHYARLMDSGLCEELNRAGLLIPHEEVEGDVSASPEAYRILRPQLIPFVSYPYEWCFGQLRDAALATLDIQRRALDHGMTLKDASAYNVQFQNGRPVFIDTLSFETYQPGAPWVAYRQFCQHFLAPLALMRHTDARLGQLFRIFLDGVPLDLASRLLPWKTRLHPWLLLHLHLHARSQRHFANRKAEAAPRRPMSLRGMRGLIDNLASTIRGLRWEPKGTEWADYYEATNYAADAMAHKQRIVERWIDRIDPPTIWDLGANTGVFSRLAAKPGREVVAFDIDPAAVERNYQQCVRDGQRNILPLVLDLTNPSPGIGWSNEERAPLAERGPADLTLALALVHHLAISHNLPFGHIADGLSRMGRRLIVEFVAKEDSQAQRLMAGRDYTFPNYTRQAFEAHFRERFHIRDIAPIPGTQRILYFMETARRFL
ncbi:MAG: class I SAM-dependent methyltransferase [Candidatus Sumerlaeota bacterium]|nr:class I SAM-dependent methyltransferase [Candidatus Sumerlaeota bacterium]